MYLPMQAVPTGSLSCACPLRQLIYKKTIETGKINIPPKMRANIPASGLTINDTKPAMNHAVPEAITPEPPP